MTPGWPRMTPGWPRMTSGWPRMTPGGPRTTPGWTRITQGDPGWPQFDPLVTQDDPRVTQEDPRVTQEDLRVTRDEPWVTQDDPQDDWLTNWINDTRGGPVDLWSCLIFLIHCKVDFQSMVEFCLTLSATAFFYKVPSFLKYIFIFGVYRSVTESVNESVLIKFE